MLVYKAAQVVTVVQLGGKPYEFADEKGDTRRGVTYTAKAACVSASGDVAAILIKAPNEESLAIACKPIVPGKPYDLPITEIIPLSRSGTDRKAGYEYVYKVGDLKKPAAYVA